MKGFMFGFIDNLIVAISAILGIYIDTYLPFHRLNIQVFFQSQLRSVEVLLTMN